MVLHAGRKGDYSFLRAFDIYRGACSAGDVCAVENNPDNIAVPGVHYYLPVIERSADAVCACGCNCYIAAFNSCAASVKVN